MTKKAEIGHKLADENQCLVTILLLAGWGAIFEKRRTIDYVCPF